MKTDGTCMCRGSQVFHSLPYSACHKRMAEPACTKGSGFPEGTLRTWASSAVGTMWLSQRWKAKDGSVVMTGGNVQECCVQAMAAM